MSFDQFVGIPYADKGRDFSGVDCWGLIVLVYRVMLAFDLPSLTDRYSTAADQAEIEALIAEERRPWVEIERGAERPLDLVHMMDDGSPTHIGLVVQPGRLLHAERSRSATVIQPYRHGLIGQRVIGFYRHQVAHANVRTDQGAAAG